MAAGCVVLDVAFREEGFVVSVDDFALIRDYVQAVEGFFIFGDVVGRAEYDVNIMFFREVEYFFCFGSEQCPIVIFECREVDGYVSAKCRFGEVDDVGGVRVGFDDEVFYVCGICFDIA